MWSCVIITYKGTSVYRHGLCAKPWSMYNSLTLCWKNVQLLNVSSLYTLELLLTSIQSWKDKGCPGWVIPWFNNFWSILECPLISIVHILAEIKISSENTFAVLFFPRGNFKQYVFRPWSVEGFFPPHWEIIF